jgi:hypothetical protein
VGDELGSALIGSRLVRDVMRLCFLMERQYAPYAKWFGSAFAQLESAASLSDLLMEVQRASTWQERDRWLSEAYRFAAGRHNGLGLTEPMPERTMHFFGRPLRVMALHGFADALLRSVRDPQMVQLAKRRPIGSIDQISDNTDLLEATELRESLRVLYGPR